MILKETLESAPIELVIKFFSIFNEEWTSLPKKKDRKVFVMSKYHCEDYIKLLKRKFNKNLFRKELKKMLPRTSFKVMIELLNTTNDILK